MKVRFNQADVGDVGDVRCFYSMRFHRGSIINCPDVDEKRFQALVYSVRLVVNFKLQSTLFGLLLTTKILERVFNCKLTCFPFIFL